jgi:hypothetical protein
MIRFLKKEHQGVITQLCSRDVQTSKPSISLDLQWVINNNSKLFEDISKGITPIKDHNNGIQFIPIIVPPSIRPYR